MADYDNKTTAPWSEFADQINKVVIGNSVTTVGDYAFMGCVNLTSATLGSNLRSIDKSAFYMCDLSEVAIPDTVETIKERAFRYNKYLKTATLGSQLKTIGIYSFANCALTEIIIPDQVTEIDLYAFADTPLTKAMIPASVKTIVVRAFGYRGDDPVEDFTIYGYSGTIVYGDVNGDGSVTIDDATLVQKAVAELAELDAKQQKAADVNGDDSVTIDDATLIQKYVAEIIDRFPVHALLG